MPTPDTAPATLRRRLTRLATAVILFAILVCAYLAVMARYGSGDPARTPLPSAELPTTSCTLWFIGSSTIARWASLSKDMAPWDAHNRGVDGALVPAITQRLDRTEASPPAAIVFYGGENDIAAGASATDAMIAFERFMAIKTRRYGGLPVIAFSLKPGPARWANRPRQTAYNAGLVRLAGQRRDLFFVDIRPAMLVDDRPGPFYIADGIHMNAAGYANWTTALRKTLVMALPPARLRSCGVEVAS